MSQLPITRMTLYKHGVGYFQRRGLVSGEEIKLTFRREEMDDLLKSLTIIDHSPGQVRGVDYETPQSQAERLAGCSVILEDSRSLRDLVMALRGRKARLLVSDGPTPAGTLLGLDEDEQKPLTDSLVSILEKDSETVTVLPLNRITGVELIDDTAAADLRFFLQTALGQETHRSITIRLTPGEHDLEVGYIAPAPTWRVSYRLVTAEPEPEQTSSSRPEALLQGWGIFDNRLEEDLHNISLSLTAGMPISFIYDLYTPHTPPRPVIEDKTRVAAGPVMFEEAMLAEELPEEDMARGAGVSAPPEMRSLKHAAPPRPYVSAAKMAATVDSAAAGRAIGELFQYHVSVPVTVGRGQSAMVPIVSDILTFKKDLIYNGTKMADHPVATLRFNNSTGLTLEHGPVTVVENGEYVGEAILPFTVDQAEAVISYAVELGVQIKEEIRTETQLHALHIKDDYMLQNHYDIRRTTYRLTNRMAQVKTVLVEHNLSRDYTIFDTPDPVEKTVDTHRYQVEIPAGKTTDFTVHERCLRSRREQLQNLSYRNLQKYFEDKFLDKHTFNSLKALLDTWAEIDRLQKAIAEQEQQQDKIYKAQEQIQKNMAVLSAEGEERKLRERYVKQLSQSEEQLAALAQTIAGLQMEIKEKREQVKKMISDLERN